jgi:Xaa-Pro aminopeptidase
MDRLRLSFSTLTADALLVTHLPNIQYLCGFTGSSGMLLVEESHAVLFTDSRYTFQARQELFGARLRIAKNGLIRAVGDRLRSHRRPRRLGYSPSQLTVAQKSLLERASGRHLRWIDANNAVEKLRAIKDASELATMRDAAGLISKVFQRVVRSVKPGLTELQLAGRIDYSMRELGASGPSFETIVASGPRSAWAHARPSSKPLRKNELVVLDQGAILCGYCSDMTRTVFLGRSPAKIRRMYQAVLEAQEAARSVVRPGITAAEVDAAARRVLGRFNLRRYFTHSTGHGLGLEVHEMPRLGRGETAVIEQGMVVTIEPGVYVEGLGGIRIEDDVVVTASGGHTITTAPREFIEL